MKKNIFHIITATTLLLVLPEPLFTQTIRGVVRDGVDGIPMIGVNIIMINPARGTTTGLNGEYEFLNIARGSTPTISVGGLNKTITVAYGTNWMNFWTNPPSLPSDFDGNYYHTVTIGTQTWMVENLLVTHFQNGDTISNVTSNVSWSARTAPGYCWWNNDIGTNKNMYGGLYNWHTVSAGNLCPINWHVPSDSEWRTMEVNLGMIVESYGDVEGMRGTDQGSQLKSTNGWYGGGNGTNTSGFTALPGGYRSGVDGSFISITSDGSWWTKTQYPFQTPLAYDRHLIFSLSTIGRFINEKEFGFSIRCIQNMIPTLSTSQVSPQSTSAEGGGYDLDDRGSQIIAKGVCWNTTGNPSILSDNYTNDGNGTDNYVSTLATLTPNTTYYVKAYATNSTGTAYGNEISFTTNPIPLTVITSEISDIQPISAISGGNVTSDGGAPVTEKGICWNTTGDPTILDKRNPAGSMGTGSFTGYFTGLLPVTTYYVRAYATNAAGTSYGDQLSFTTVQTFNAIEFNNSLTYGTVTDFDGTDYRTIKIGGQVWMAENLKTIKLNDGTPILNLTSDSEWDVEDGSEGHTSAAYCWYDNNEALCKDIFGALYNWNAVNTGNLCPTNWHVPTNDEWMTLITNLGGINGAGNELKEMGTAHWASPNPGVNNQTGFTALAGGFRMPGAAFYWIGVTGFWWSGTEGGTTDAWNINLNSGSGYVGNVNNPKKNGFSVRCVKNVTIPTVSAAPISIITAVSAFGGGDVTSDGGATIIERGICWSITENPTIADNKSWASAGTGSYTCNLANLDPNTLYYVRAFARNSVGTAYGNQVFFTTSAELSLISFPDLTYGTVSDIDGNNYRTIQIDSQVWMAENLKTTKYNDNTSISIAINDNEWYTLTTPAYCWYKNDAGNYKDIYGALYNWYVGDAASNGGKNVCPVGWHIPSNAEWTTLTDYLGGTTVAGGKLKEVGTSHWWTPNEGATNETGFTAIPGGGRIKDGDFYGHFGHIGEIGFWWSQTTDVSDRLLRYNDGEVDLFSVFPKQCGFSIRCVQDIGAPMITTNEITSITQTTAYGGGNIRTDIMSPITARGVCWSTVPTPTVDLTTKTEDGTGTGAFVSTITGLSAGTTYYVRAYITMYFGNAETVYGEEISFTTSDSDIDGNNYTTVTIGSQIWMGENLKTTRLNDGTPIPNASIQADWAALTSPGYCWYNNDEATYKNTYGALYNWQAVNIYKLCPTGWHVPTEDDYATLAEFLGDLNIAGGKLKEIGTDHWWNPNTGATDDFGFTALPGGERSYVGFGSIRFSGYFWLSSTKIFIESFPPTTESNYAWAMNMQYGNSHLGKGVFPRGSGASVRCIKGAINLVLSTTDISSITQNTANTGGNIIYDGGSSVTDRGICWNTSPNPTISDNHISEGIGTGIFTSSLTDLTANTTYYVRAYATNSLGTSYGDEVSFTTYKTDAFSDVDGNFYNKLEIGTQVWMGENLKTTRYSNGDLIGTVDPYTLPWRQETAPSYQWAYGANEGNVRTYGRLYTWFAANNRRGVCPTDWHLPTDTEWHTLALNLDPGATLEGRTESTIAGDKLKETGTTHWNSPNTATNDYGFTALPGGMMTLPDGPFDFLHYSGHWWTATEFTTPQLVALSRDIYSGISALGREGGSKAYGYSVRCIATTPIIVTNISDDGPGSLRDAITQSNSSIEVLESIKFNIPGEGLNSIRLLSPLPTISDPVIIDGYSQPGASATTSTMLVELNGTNAGTGSNGLTVNASNCTLKGLVINKFSGNGIQITGGTGNIISANSVYGNSELGIDLGSDGAVTENDDGDVDSGPNNLQNYPVLDKTVISLGEIYIDGHLNSLPEQNYTLEFFASKLADNSGNGEGQTYLGSTTVTTDINGVAAFTNEIFPYETIYGDVITATATDPDGNTSEFSKGIGGLPDQHLSTSSLDYHVNPSGVPNIADENKIVNAVNSAFNTWTGITTANFTFNYVNKTDEQHAHIDGVNVVSFSDDEYLFGDWVLAITAKTLKLGPTDAETQILDADIIFNPFFVKHQLWNFGIAGDLLHPGYFDIQSVTTHEIGHILGLLHSGVHNATMWFEMPQGTDARSLEQDDRSWASYKYPEPGNNFGTISGNIAYGYDDALSEPIAGALILAINTATRDTVHSYSDANGNYLVPGLSSGTYNVYIEPLDGDVRGRPLSPRNISLYIYCNTNNFDYPGEFYSAANEGAEETQDIVASVTVNAGSGTSGINFVTNKDITNPTVVSVTPPDISKSPDIGIRFSEPLDMTTVNKESCYLIKSGEMLPIGGSYVELEGETNAILFYPEEVLNYNTLYTLYITTMVTDLKGNHLSAMYQSSFTTGAGDTNPPAIIGIIPSNGATGVFVDDRIVVSFSEPMEKQTVQNSFSINPNIAYTLTWDNENKTVTVSHSSSFTEGAIYNIAVSTGAKDMSGNALGNIFSSSFRVVPAAPPAIKYLEPGQTMTSGITAKTPVVADFSEPIKTATVNETTFKLLKGGANGTPVTGNFEFLNENSRVVFRPGADLDFNQKYTVILTTGIWDASQSSQNLQNEKIVSFTTEIATTMPSIRFIDPPSDNVGAVVTIGGKGFDPDPSKNSVTFYNTVAAQVISASLTSLTVKVPEGAESGVVNLKVNGIAEDANSPYDFLVIQPYSDPCNEAKGSAPTGGNSRDVATDFNGTKAYVTNSGSNTVSVVDLASLTTTKTIDVGEYPLMIDIDPEGKRAYVTNHGSRTVSVIDLKTETEIKKINVGINPYGVAVSPDGEHVFVANYSSQDVSVVDVDPTSGGFDHVTSNITTGTNNRQVDIDANSSMIVVTGNDGLKIIELIKTEFGFDYSKTNSSSGTPTRDTKIITEAGLAVVSTMDGRLLFIGIAKGTDTFGAVVANSKAGAKAGQVQPDFSGVFLYVSNPYDDQVTVYKMTFGGSGSEVGSYRGFSIEEYWTIPTGISPQGMSINRLNNELLVVNESGETGSNGSVTAVKICCLEKSPSDDIVALALNVQGMINSGDITKLRGKLLIVTLNAALRNISRERIKLAIADLNLFIATVKTYIRNKQVAAVRGNALISSANAIINKLKGSKSEGEEYNNTDIEQPVPEPVTQTKLGVIYPNPTKEGITINYEVAANELNGGKVSIQVYDVTGRVIGNIVNEKLEPGRYSATWNGRYENGGSVSRGIYYIRFEAGKNIEIKRIMLVR